MYLRWELLMTVGEPTDLIREGRAYANALAIQHGKFESADILNRVLDALEEQMALAASRDQAIASQDAALTMRINEAVAWGRERKAERDEARAALAEANAAIARVNHVLELTEDRVDDYTQETAQGIKLLASRVRHAIEETR
ncbi:hypothetical protein SAMN04489793_3283 [Tsukamurella tyrosinosolvens]|uniref:Uncharacterized protein n=2 Tax=Tsukamurella tyrosinosolvens TaxID=57704 RepID=A0A1H4VNJ0_TSUTY|nr:hypothetical protein SAMN04489793_3283 [Tsukamurella tyrosinosolvens]